MEIEFKFRCLLMMPIWWLKYLPENEEDWINYKIDFRQKEINAIIGIIDRNLQLDRIGQSPDIFEIGAPGKSLYLLITGLWPKIYIEKLRIECQDNETESFRFEIKEVINNIYSTIIDLLRNQFGQFWIPTNLPTEKMAWMHSEWQDTDHKWKPLFPNTQFLNSRIRTNGLTKESWIDFGNMLKNNKKSEMKTVMYFVPEVCLFLLREPVRRVMEQCNSNRKRFDLLVQVA